ncbi:MAG: hypothetical protein V7L14_30255 [Nostoc sp.]|uniref:hypothetical protein n=1 Tax=Nostoc sp. TaxID=1180 RepID=UPI002FF706EB
MYRIANNAVRSPVASPVQRYYAQPCFTVGVEVGKASVSTWLTKIPNSKSKID